MTSVIDDAIDWPFPNKILGCATDSESQVNRLRD